MISVQEAKKIISDTIPFGPIHECKLTEALGLGLAQEITAPINFPSSAQSAMDGFAIRFGDLLSHETFQVTEVIQAGQDVSHLSFVSGQACRIFTGAALPAFFDTVIMQEHATVNHATLSFQGEIVPGQHVRPIGSQTKQGDIVLPKGHVLTPASLSLLASLGIEKIPVVQKPIIQCIHTGNELIQVGKTLAPGQVYESNSIALTSALQQMHLTTLAPKGVEDELNALQESIRLALEKADVILLTGGVSVGDYDFVHQALSQLGVDILFHKIKQKPGKPLLFGQYKNKFIFGLPGNPGSVMTCFYQYVKPALLQYLGHPQPFQTGIFLPLLAEYVKKPGLTHFVKAQVQLNGVMPLDHQESYKMNGFAHANCLIEFSEEITFSKKNDSVLVHCLNAFA